MALDSLLPWVVTGVAGAALGSLPYWRLRSRVLAQEAERRRLEDTLAQTLATQEALKEASTQATEALEVRTQFLANLSHEIRTPLNGVLGMTSVLLETELGREQRDIAQTIAKSGESLMAVLNEVLDFSKLEANAIHIEIFPFDVRECVEDVLDLFAGLAFDKGLDLASRFAPDVPPQVLGDVIRVRQVLANLVSNAVKFTEKGEVVVDVELDDGVLVLTVSDTGSGMSQEALSGLFVPFTQFSRDKGQLGTGLGLVISKRLVELMHGSIAVESSPELGSEFTVRIPVGVTASRPSDSLWEAPGTRVCLVGPEITSRDVLGDYLREWGLAVKFCQHAGEVDADATDLLVIFAESVDARCARLPARIPRIFVSWLTDVTSQEQADVLGKAAVLDRPVRIRSLRQTLRHALLGEATTTTTRRSLSRFEEMASRLPRNILVAEDNATNRRVITVMLRRLGYEPVVVEHGELAVAAAMETTFDVVFMDIHMPVMDGIQATLAIREALPQASQPWIVALTAGVNSEIRASAKEAGMNDFITKPFMVESLRAALEQSTVDLHTGDGSYLAQLRALYASTPDEFRALVHGHVRGVDLLLTDMEHAAQSGDLETLALAAHSLKASSRMFGQSVVGEVAESVETLADRGDLEGSRRHLSLLHAHWEEARGNLEQESDAFLASDSDPN